MELKTHLLLVDSKNFAGNQITLRPYVYEIITLVQPQTFQMPIRQKSIIMSHFM